MKIAKSLKRVTSLTAVIVLMLGVIPFTAAVNVTTVYADDEVITDPVESPAEEAPVEEVVEEPVETPAEEAPVEEVVEEPVETPAEEAEVLEEEIEAADVTEEAVETSEESELADPEPVEPEAGEDLSDLVEVLSEAEAQITDENGEALPLASKEAAEVLENSDPFFWSVAENRWVGYAKSVTGCPANVHCIQSDKPFQAAVDNAGAGNMIYVAQGTYDEDVVLGTASTTNLSFTAFHTITVPATNTAPEYVSGYALLNSITLNVNFGSTKGVYAKSIIVNGAGSDDGWLEDGLALVNDGGTVEADMVIYGANGHHRVKDAHHASDPEVNDFEWECGEPNAPIWVGRTYRMILKDPLNADILKYYTDHGDERIDEDGYDNSNDPKPGTTPFSYAGPYLNLSAADRIKDLLIGVNRSESYDSWNHHDEERIYWYLLGNTGYDNNGKVITLDSTQQAIADKITGGYYDDNTTDFWDAWFLWPIFEYNTNGTVSPVFGDDNRRQLTFFVFDPQPVYGCTDPESLNYDPNATDDDESCRYENTIIVPPAGPPAPLPIPVTGEIEELFLIPVTGIDPADTDGIGFIEVALLMSVMVLGAGLFILKTKKQKEH